MFNIPQLSHCISSQDVTNILSKKWMTEKLVNSLTETKSTEKLLTIFIICKESWYIFSKTAEFDKNTTSLFSQTSVLIWNKMADYHRHILRLPIFVQKASENPKFWTFSEFLSNNTIWNAF